MSLVFKQDPFLYVLNKNNPNYFNYLDIAEAMLDFQEFYKFISRAEYLTSFPFLL